MRNESYGIESYSPYLDLDLEDIKVFDGGDLELSLGNTKKALNTIKNYIDRLLKDGKFPIMIGGSI